MISFRAHALTLVAVLLALAVGVALGGGPLSEIGRADSGDAASSEQSAQLEETSQVAAFQDEFAGDVSQQALSGALTKRPVAVVTLPGVDSSVVQSLGTLIKQAGGTVSGTYAVKPGLLDQDNSSLVSSLTAQVAETAPKAGVATTDPPYVRMGRLIGYTVSTRQDSGEAGDTATQNVLSSLDGSDFLARTTGNGQRGSLVLVVLGDQDGQEAGLGKLVAQLASGMAGSADGMVVAGTTDSGSDGLLQQIRADEDFAGKASSTDSVQSLTGRVATVLTLKASAAGGVGQYGAHGSDGALPRG